MCGVRIGHFGAGRINGHQCRPQRSCSAGPADPFEHRVHLHIGTVCGGTHTKHHHNTDYRFYEAASQPLTFDEPCGEVPKGAVFQATGDFRLQRRPLPDPG